MHIVALFQGKLSGVLTAPNYEPRINTLDELADSNLILLIRQYHLENMKRYKVKTAQKLVAKCVLSDYPSFEETYAYIQRNGSVSMIAFKNDLEVLTYKPHRVDKISDNNYIYVIRARFAFRKGVAVLLTMNQIIKGITRGGLIIKWLSDSLKISFMPDSPHTVILTRKHLQSAFAILLLGFFLSLSVFIGELLIRYYYYYRMR